MTRTALPWLVHIGWDVLLAAAFWRGCLLGETGWLNLFTFVVWFMAIGGIAVGIGNLCAGITKQDDSWSWLSLYGATTDLILLAALIWIGWLWTAGFLSVGCLLHRLCQCSPVRRRVG
jgi:hypothetical protein